MFPNAADACILSILFVYFSFMILYVYLIFLVLLAHQQYTCEEESHPVVFRPLPVKNIHMKFKKAKYYNMQVT